MKILMAILLLLPAVSFAKAAKAHPKPRAAAVQRNDAYGFNLIVNMGAKRSWYKVWQDKGGKFYAASTGGKPTVGVLSDQHFFYLNFQSRQVASMPATSIKSCPKSNIMLAKGTKVIRAACLDSKNQTTAKMTELATMMTMLQ
ncbi:MAG: hypothetical protein J7501_16945 [Bdellovibrio sp.]|nr:hypothetical protein [Bdellovibrio sp.]